MEVISEETHLVADTSVLIGALPFIRAVIETEALPYVVYIPYVVLTELDRGRAAAAVNQLISRHMRQQSTRVVAQHGVDHDRVFEAKGVVANSDDLILGAALQLKEAGNHVILITNDHNLISKSCANQLRAMTSFDLVLFLPQAIPTLDKFIVKDIQTLCPQRETIVRFTIELLACAIKMHLVSVGANFKPSSTADHLVFEIMDKAVEAQITSKPVLKRTKDIIKKCRGKSREISVEDVRRLVKYACALLEEVKMKNKFSAKVLNVCKGIYAGIKTGLKRTSSLTFDYCPKKKNVSTAKLPSNQQKKVIAEIAELTRKEQHDLYQGATGGLQKKPKGTEEDTKRREYLRLNKIEDMEISGEELLPSVTTARQTGGLSRQCGESTSPPLTFFNSERGVLTPTKVSARIASKQYVSAALNIFDGETANKKGRLTTEYPPRRRYEKSLKYHRGSPCKPAENQTSALFQSVVVTHTAIEVSERCEDPNEMDLEEGAQAKRGRQLQERLTVINVEKEPVFQMLNSAWQRLNNIAGSWASYCRFEYPFPYDVLPDLIYDHPHVNRCYQLVAHLADFYERLWKLNFTVSRDIQMEVAERFMKNITQVWEPVERVSHPSTIVSAAEVLSYFQDDRKREMMSGGLEQLKIFRKIIEKCHYKLLSDIVAKVTKKPN
ncbi:hypothetical protein BIW11_12363 [Tropilaelaps mercedesae]|uniref:PIN domain-containing protein n=1 Tax=Tropilaelaps mercedesae TaxID=418985 RepID=A0A1V9X6X0_9ACAR|nr:hypothetical protein BIW11_12363 [Tropilaelaps mercedesae]